MAVELWNQLAGAVLAGLDESHLLRHRRLITPIDATHLLFEGRECVNFASNNYLGLTHHPQVIAAAEQSLRESGTGSGASPLITGYGPSHAAAEQHIARWKQSQAAVLLPSGYQANHAAVQTFAALAEKSRQNVRFLLDKLCHASLIDAVRGSGMPFRIFPHNHLPKLERLLTSTVDKNEFQVVVTESIFSMDGDAADLAGLAELKLCIPSRCCWTKPMRRAFMARREADWRPNWACAMSLMSRSSPARKHWESGGGAVCGSQVFCECLVNLARAYIYSTHLPPAMAAAIDAAITVLENNPLRQKPSPNFPTRSR